MSGTGADDGHDDRLVNIYKEKVKQLKLTGDQFTDEEFPPNPRSLILNWESDDPHTREFYENWKQYVWIRADQIPCFTDGDPNMKLLVFEGDVEPNDII